MSDDQLQPDGEAITAEELARLFTAYFRPCADPEPEDDGYVFH